MVIGITLATIALLRSRSGGGASFFDPDGLRAPVEKAIDDEERRTKALGVLDSMAELFADYDRSLRASVHRYLSLVGSFDSGPSEITESAIEPLEAKRAATLLGYADLRAQLLDIMTTDEWDAVFPQAEE